jgi:hypothetical protein
VAAAVGEGGATRRRGRCHVPEVMVGGRGVGAVGGARGHEGEGLPGLGLGLGQWSGTTEGGRCELNEMLKMIDMWRVMGGVALLTECTTSHTLARSFVRAVALSVRSPSPNDRRGIQKRRSFLASPRLGDLVGRACRYF